MVYDPNKFTETHNCQIFLQLLQYEQNLGNLPKDLLLWKSVNEGKRTVWEQRNLKRLGWVAGDFDYRIMLPGGKHIYVEMKRDKTSKISTEQKAFKTWCDTNNVLAIISYKPEEAIQFIKSHI